LPRRYIQKPVRVAAEDVAWFNEHYPQKGSWTWFVRAALCHFIELHEEEALTDTVRKAVAEILHETESEDEDGNESTTG